jgi:hypothetical protein
VKLPLGLFRYICRLRLDFSASQRWRSWWFGAYLPLNDDHLLNRDHTWRFYTSSSSLLSDSLPLVIILSQNITFASRTLQCSRHRSALRLASADHKLRIRARHHLNILLYKRMAKLPRRFRLAVLYIPDLGIDSHLHSGILRRRLLGVAGRTKVDPYRRQLHSSTEHFLPALGFRTY